jgi:hypothetical protein
MKCKESSGYDDILQVKLPSSADKSAFSAQSLKEQIDLNFTSTGKVDAKTVI